MWVVKILPLAGEVAAKPTEGEVLLTLCDVPLRPPNRSGTASPFRGRISKPLTHRQVVGVDHRAFAVAELGLDGVGAQAGDP